ncbi:uncharacterized protein LOC135697669 [Ochlerotatus camptorhynchus]|uniref:uncharacterized protein LOC135697669 n=1 Tax=Ochlerotatus camptorhynchus TaxID=644619 RepID=UPI0031E24371
MANWKPNPGHGTIMLGQIDVDFRLMYGINDGVKKWNLAFPKLVKYLDRPYKDDFSKKILECLTSPEFDLDVKTCAFLLLLNNVLKPTKVTRKFKPSILAAQEEIILFAASNDLAAGVLTKFNEDYSNYGFQPAPKLIFIGKGIDSLEGEFQVRFQDFSYRFDSASRAIDVLVKFCAVFGLEHSRTFSTVKPGNDETDHQQNTISALAKNLEDFNKAAVAFTLELHNESTKC